MKKDAKTAIMDAAETLFMKHGFRRVTVDEICRSAGVSRKTFYTYFTNKDALTIEVLDKIVKMVTGNFAEIMNSNASLAFKMEQMMELKVTLGRHLLSMDFLTDLFTTSSDEVSQFYHQKVDENIAIARSLFLQAQERGEIRKELDIDFIMAMFNYQTDLYEKPEFRARFKDGENMMKQMSELFLFGIVGNKEG